MKTTDLIPILLSHLKQGDKYGLELIDACKKCSNGKIEVKQPTLYSVLKKLEKSKFISSYWQDSDIGGKRHYFKITENGLAQLETYPPLEELVKLAITEDESSEQVSDTIESEVKEEKIEKSPSPFDNFKIEQVNEVKLNSHEEAITEEKKSIEAEVSVNSFNIFDALDAADNEDEEDEQTIAIDNSLELNNPFKDLEDKTVEQINEENIKLIDKDAQVEEFVNSNVVAFTEKIEPIKITKKEEIILTPPVYNNQDKEEIKYQDYIDKKTDKSIKNTIKVANKRLTKVVISSIISLALIASLFVLLINDLTPILGIFLICPTLFIVFYASNFIGKFVSRRYILGYNYKFKYKQKIIFRASLFVFVCLLLLLINFVAYKGVSVSNFVAPISITALVFTDYLLSCILYKK